MSDYYNSGSGYTCYGCGKFILNGEEHTCPGFGGYYVPGYTFTPISDRDLLLDIQARLTRIEELLKKLEE